MSPKDIGPSAYDLIERILRCHSLHNGDDEPDPYESHRMWHSEELVEWFNGHGYTVYETMEVNGDLLLETTPRILNDMVKEAEFPYAHYNAQADPESERLATLPNQGRMIYAQDNNLRHVAIKAMHIESEEYRIVNFLRQQSLETMRDNCIIPILDLLRFKNACFAVMPRWGFAPIKPETHSMRNLLHIMQAILKALVFLHSHKIIHRDISFANIVVNHFGALSSDYWPLRQPMLSAGSLSYALIDFDLAMMLPPSTDTKRFRLPYHCAFVGSSGPSDVRQCEFDYNPFAYDVGCLGRLFCDRYQHHTVDLPLLAPLFDMMVTRNIEKRFTAEEALQFVNRILEEADPAQLSVIERPEDESSGTYEEYDRWKGLPIDFQQKWAAYREPYGIPFKWKILRALAQSDIPSDSMVPIMRRCISRFF